MFPNFGPSPPSPAVKLTCRAGALPRSAMPAFLFALSLVMPGCLKPDARRDAAERATQPIRAIWITRFDYRTADDVKRIVNECADAGFDTLLFQVRGNGTVFYRSTLEPWADELGGREPGFDPLALACAEAHRRGVELHAWVNMMPAWRGRQPPTNLEQLYWRHPEWFWYDQHGARQSLSDFYVSLNPCLPDVRAYLEQVVQELVMQYPIDGLHLDYIRFPNEPPATPAASGLDYPRDAQSLALFRSETGLTPEADSAAWNHWRAECVTRLVAQTRRVVQRSKPSLKLSAAVGPIPARAMLHFQDGLGWMKEGLLDYVFLMNYTNDPIAFDDRLDPWLAVRSPVRVVPGLRVGKGDDAGDNRSGENLEVLRTELQTSLRRCRGFSIFAYASLFDSVNSQSPGRSELRMRRLEVLRSELSNLNASD